MRSWFESLRGRLVAAMALMFSLGLGGALALRPVEAHWILSGQYHLNLLREPYQDVSVLLPFSIGAVLLIWLVSGWSLRHLAAASRDAAIVGPSNSGRRISTRKLPAEIRPLVDAVNGALDRLAEAYAAEQRFVADAAHELRTPLAVLSLRLQRAKLEGELNWHEIDKDLARVTRLADQMIDLARNKHIRQSAASEESHVANLSRLAREAAAAVIPLAEQAGREIEVDLPTSVLVQGRSDDLRDMLRNLLDNALAHGRGTVHLSGQIGTAPDGNRQACITISDEGPGVPPGLRESVFERFRKGSSEASGNGLGLAIVREVVQGHGGSVEFLPGLSCRVQVTLPIAQCSARRHAA